MEKRQEIINYFNTHHDNRSPVIAKHFNFTVTYVDKVLDAYLSTKRNYNGAEIKTKKAKKEKLKKEKRYKLAVHDDKDNLIGKYTSITQAASALKIRLDVVSKRFRNNIMIKKVRINHYSIKKTYIYTKL